MEDKSLACELLEELKHTHKRLFAICLIELAIIIGMIIGFLIYESQFEYVSTEKQTQEITNIDSSEVSQTINR